MAPAFRRAPLFAVTALLLSAPAFAQDPPGAGGAQDGSWFPAEKQETPRPAPDEVKADDAAEKPAPAPKPAPARRPASAPLPRPNSAVPPPYVAEKATSKATKLARRPAGNVAVYLGGSGAAGNLNGDTSMASAVDGAVVLGLDLQFHLNRHFTLGGYAQLGGIEREQGCVGSRECEDNLFRLGVSAHYHLRPGKGVDPWLSAGTGLSTLTFANKLTDGSKTSVTYVGFDLINLQAGVDFALGRVFSLGPYVGLNNGVYTGVASETRGGEFGRTRDADRLATPTLHTWTSLGVRGRFNFF